MSETEQEPQGNEEAPSRPEQPLRPGILFSLVLLVLTAGVGAGLFAVMSARQERLQAQEVARARETSAGLPVRVVTPRMTGESLEMLLPGDVRASLEAPIYAKVAGYLKKVSVDKGDRVDAGQLLAVLESPEAEEEYRRARAEYEIAKITNDRNQDLVRDHTVSQQVADESKARLLMASANMERLRVIVGYEQLRAPFSGVVTVRNYDPGFLLPAATGSSPGLPVFIVARIDRLKVYVYVPQSDASFVRVGDPARITFDESPGRVFAGRVSRFSRALDVATRTMLTEIDLPGTDQILLPGMYAKVKLERRQLKSYPIVPDEALVFENDKVFVPIITPQRTIHLQPVTLGLDNGTEVQVTTGLTGNEPIALGVGQTVAEGLRVLPVKGKENGAAPGGKAPAPARPPTPAPGAKR